MKGSVIYTNDLKLEYCVAKYPNLFVYSPLYALRRIEHKYLAVSLCPNLENNILLPSNDDIESFVKAHDFILFDESSLPIPVANAVNITKCSNMTYLDTHSNGPKTSITRKIFIRVADNEGCCLNVHKYLCFILNKIQSNGYSFFVESDIDILRNTLSIIKQDKTPDIHLFITQTAESADITVNLSQNNYSESAENSSRFILQHCRENLPHDKYLTKNVNFLRESFSKYIRVIVQDNDVYMYRAVSRKTDIIPKKSFLYSSTESDLMTRGDIYELEQLFEICYHELCKDVAIQRALASPYVKIANIDQMIVSFIGSRKCNLKCNYCFSDHAACNTSQLSEKDIITSLDFCISLHDGKNVHIDNFIAGEPCTDFETYQRVYTITRDYQKAHNQLYSFGILTNGTCMTDEQLLWLNKNIAFIGLSLDGDEETNDKLRVYSNGSGTYKDAVKFVEQVKHFSWVFPMGVSCVITANNLDITSLFKHFHNDLGIQYVTIKPVRADSEQEYALTDKNLSKLKKGYIDFLDYIKTELQRDNYAPLFAILHPIDYLGRFIARVGLEDRIVVKRCGAGEHIFSIDNDNQIYACDSFNGIEYAIIGNCYDGVNGCFSVPYVHDVNDMPCNDCWARYQCGGVCSYVRHINEGKDNGVIKFECELARFLIEQSILFWQYAKKYFSETKICKIKLHMRDVGFGTFEHERDNLIYAPC